MIFSANANTPTMSDNEEVAVLVSHPSLPNMKPPPLPNQGSAGVVTTVCTRILTTVRVSSTAKTANISSTNAEEDRFSTRKSKSAIFPSTSSAAAGTIRRGS